MPTDSDEVTSDHERRHEEYAKELAIRDQAKLKILQTRMRRRPEEVPVELVEEAITDCGGNLTEAAKKLDVSFARLAHMVDGSRTLTILTSRLREAIVDEAERVLKHHLTNNSLQAATFALKTIGKNRGYVERSEQEKNVHVEVRTLDVSLDRLTSAQLRELRSLQTVASTEPVTIDGESEERGA
tara:strand:+ start:3260 stop:3814 length:555 start_codon:yes stop_codon:yes gene_type:complete